MKDFAENLASAAVKNSYGFDPRLIINEKRFLNNVGTEQEAQEILIDLKKIYQGISFFVEKFAVHFGPIDLYGADNNQWEKANGCSIWYSPPICLDRFK